MCWMTCLLTCMVGHRWYIYGGLPNLPRLLTLNYCGFGYGCDCCNLNAMVRGANAERDLMAMSQNNLAASQMNFHAAQTQHVAATAPPVLQPPVAHPATSQTAPPQS